LTQELFDVGWVGFVKMKGHVCLLKPADVMGDQIGYERRVYTF
jgi:hypothetical protein